MSRATSPTSPNHALVWGLGSGLHVRPLLERFARVTVYPLDVDPADAVAAHERLTKDINILRAIAENKLEIIFRSAAEQLAHFTQLASGLAAEQVDIVTHLPALVDVPSAAQPVAALLERMARERQRSPRIQTRLRDNAKTNRSALAAGRGVDHLRGLADGQPALVLAGGPSLSRARNFLPLAAQRSWLIAVDTATPVVRQCGVEPRLIASIDPHAISERHLTKVSPIGVPAQLACQPSSAPELLRQVAGPHWLAVPDHDRLGRLLHEHLALPILPGAGTVLVYAVALAQILGADPIILIGADFAFVDQLSHAQGTAHAQPITGGTLTLEGWDGKNVASSLALRSFRDATQACLACPVDLAYRRTPQVWALAGGGAKIVGAIPRQADEIASWLAKQSAVSPLSPPPLRDRADIDERLARIDRLFDDLEAPI